jgi:general stress protein YciG
LSFSFRASNIAVSLPVSTIITLDDKSVKHKKEKEKFVDWNCGRQRRYANRVGKNPHAVALGKRGGRRRAEVLSKEERQKIARKGGETSMENRTQEQRVQFARMGGQVGGKRRAHALTKEQRQEIARKAAAARWGKTK